jgi:xanthine dehydrogenase accessory factor
MDGNDILQQAAELARSGEAFALATVVWRQGPSSSQQGARAIITADGDLRGWIGGACAEPVVIREAHEVIEAGAARLLLLGSPEQFGYPAPPELPSGMRMVPIACSSEGALEVYIEPVLPVPHLVVVGSTPMAGALAQMAESLGWRAEQVAGGDFNTASVTPQSFVVVATQGQDDEAVLERATTARPAYLGLIASHRRGEAVIGYLADRGVDADVLARVKAPAGIDLGRTAHREIAVAVLAELVQLRATRTGHETVHQEQLTDPVCGMTVDTASRSAEYEGRTYYFCCAGCQRSFEADPAAYVKRESRC